MPAKKTAAPVIMPAPVRKPKPPKPPKSWGFRGEAGALDVNVILRDEGGIVLEFIADTDTITVLPGAKGARFSRELLKFAKKLYTYTTGKEA